MPDGDYNTSKYYSDAVRAVRTVVSRGEPLSNPEKQENWKHKVAHVLKEHGIVNDKTVGKLSLAINCGGIQQAEWLNKKID